MKVRNEVKLEFWSRSANEGFARTAAACFAAQLDPTLDEVNDIKTAVSEAVTNCIVHAYPDTLGKVAVRLRLLDEDWVEIQVKDWGVGIPDVDKAREPLFTTGNEERSGMGFTIMESFTDSIRVRSKVGKGTTVVLRKQIAHRPALSRCAGGTMPPCWNGHGRGMRGPARICWSATWGSSGASCAATTAAAWTPRTSTNWAVWAF